MRKKHQGPKASLHHTLWFITWIKEGLWICILCESWGEAWEVSEEICRGRSGTRRGWEVVALRGQHSGRTRALRGRVSLPSFQSHPNNLNNKLLISQMIFQVCAFLRVLYWGWEQVTWFFYLESSVVSFLIGDWLLDSFIHFFIFWHPVCDYELVPKYWVLCSPCTNWTHLLIPCWDLCKWQLCFLVV